MSIRTEPHATIRAADLADWLEQQGPDFYWVVDGDILLGERVPFPSPASVLATALRRINRNVLVLGETKETDPRRVLDALAGQDPISERIFSMTWDEPGYEDDWILYGDREAAAWAARYRRAIGA